MNARRWIQIGLGATTGLLLAFLLLGVLGRGADPAPIDAQPSVFFDTPLPPAELDLAAHTGRRVRLADLRGRTVVLFFGYTHCPDVCPLTLAHLSRALRELDPDASALQVLFVTVDPERDTPERLTRYLEAFHPAILALTGPADAIVAQARGFGVGIVVPPHEDGDSYLVDHTARTFLLDEQGRVRAAVPADATYEALREALVRLLDRSDRTPRTP